jgi:ferritin-like metal-binding protein YciE
MENTMAKAKASRQRRKTSPDAQELLVLELQQIHSAESQLSRALPRLSKAAQSQALRECLDERLEEGERVLKEVESALDELEESPGRRRNVAAEGLISDVREHVQEIEPGPALDAVLIAGIQKTEHYCIAAWGTARALAEATEEKTTVEAMQRALEEGGSFDEKLTKLAEEEITPALLSGEGSEESDEGESDEEQSGTTSGGNGTRGRGGERSNQRAGR